MKFFAALATSAFLGRDGQTSRARCRSVASVPSSLLLHATAKATTSVDAERKECAVFTVRRRLLERTVNHRASESLVEVPDLRPGDVVAQKSALLDPDTRETIGKVYTKADVLDGDYRLAHGAYVLDAGDRVGVINFSALIPNKRAAGEFDMAITSGTGDFHGAQGWILVEHPFEHEGTLERNATFNVCGLY